ncbi:MAG: M23 family metallopeptidase [Verrucomicrobiota bacterium]|jgi:murein DD-endopeptidase MepM/ murein hydrolase activator NlpD
MVTTTARHSGGPDRRTIPRLRAALPMLLLAAVSTSAQQPFRLPTANRALFEPGGEEKFFVGTTGKPWTSGCFGCVRSDGWQMHEGLDIRCLDRDKRGEPTDTVRATADGTVVYINTRPSLSNYGNYIVVQHHVEGLEIDSLYAHLREIQPGLKIGQPVKAGEPIAVMGRTSNTREGISKERAHVHFELNLFVNDRFSSWFKKSSPNERNDHGEWNGQNLLGIDPRRVLLGEQEQGDQFSLLGFLRSQNELCRVIVRKTEFPWLKRYALLIQPNPVAQKEGIAGYELALNFNGVAFEVIPRAASEIRGKGKYQLVSVNEAEYHKNPCRRLVVQKGSRWELGNHGIEALDMLTY